MHVPASVLPTSLGGTGSRRRSSGSGSRTMAPAPWRGLGRRLHDSGTRLYCVWTRNRLKSDFDIDHCFPFAAWPCNDLWNLLPSAPAVNRSKGDRLPAAEALERSRSWILEWWDLAYRRDIVLRSQFEDEAQSALPSAVLGPEETVKPEDVFEGLMVQQMVLRRDQQLAV